MPKSVKGVMDEFEAGTLHSGSSTGKRVTNPKQAIAIALSEQRQRQPHPSRAIPGLGHSRHHLTIDRKNARRDR